jgi:DNA-binding HxlR family transcriptional regulator
MIAIFRPPHTQLPSRFDRLALTLRNLERDGLITRELFPEVPPRVEYELTGLGKSLLAPTQALLDWVGNNWPDIKKARGKFAEKWLK